MGKREKNPKAAKSHHEEEEEEDQEHQQLNPTRSPIVVSSDDEEANEDLSLKIVEKSMLRACTAPQSFTFDVSSSSSSQETEVVASDSKSTKKKSRKEKSKKNKKVEKQEEETVVVAKEEEKAETSKAAESNELAETNPADIPDNVVLRKLLRGPRYFDPPDSGWGACYNCGEEGHITVNCTLAKRKKPCFVCGSLEHHAKQCTKGQDCFICKKGGHRAKDCPEKYKRVSQSSKICLKCGDSGHEMFSCKNNYSHDDLKEIQCYICDSFGHLCCADFADNGPGELSCYRCGQLGHNGLECKGAHGERTTGGSLSSCFKCGEGGHFARECTSSTKEYIGAHGEITTVGSLSSCFKCGEGGHFARECTSSTKVRKRNLELSTPAQKFLDKNREDVRPRSVPSEPGKSRKRSKFQYQGVTTTPSNVKRRGGWITEDPGDLSPGKAKMRGWGPWGSPVTPNDKWNKTYYSSNSGHASSSHSSRKTQKLHFGDSESNGPPQFYQHRYSASRFGNFSSDGMRRNYDW
ncbi:uncharacterized protein LOC131312475 isoform X2 [Rhododendron vialii]|uniref:uncharacterized protein LOC131312475 isoform X2 n=1 Tax=Rhododendron vialii TaxID=182163 RepID=UPI00265E76C9|nr:uncharacterized protein LOC131312475 isoform X2 [Rhododendron vialii]